LVVAAGAYGASGTIVLQTIGSTHLLAQTLRCPVELARVRVGVQPEGGAGTATFCVRSRVDIVPERTTIASGFVTLVLPDGTVDAAFTETHLSTGAGLASYSSIARIRGGTGRYRDARGAIVGTGLVRSDSVRRQRRLLTFRLELA
jgi:hypothetical protein